MGGRSEKAIQYKLSSSVHGFKSATITGAFVNIPSVGSGIIISFTY